MTSKKEKRYNEVPVDAVPEVQRMEAAKARYRAFREANPEFFKYLEELEEEYNTALQAAEKATKSQGVSCGDFHLYQYQTRYNAEELLQAMGRDKFLQVGGTMTTQTVYGVDKARVDAAIKSGDIPGEVAERVKVKNPRFHKPDPISVP